MSNSMRSFFRRIAFISGVAAFSVLGLVSFYGHSLPCSFYTSKEDGLAVQSFFSVTSRP